MAQHDFVINNQGFPAFRSDLNDFLNAVRTSHSGTSTPSGAVAGTIWLDTTSATTPTLKYYDGTDNISLATIDHVGNTVNWLDSTVSITGLSTTATGTVLTLTDSVSTSTVNLIIDNQKEIRFRETTANGTNYVALKAPASVSADLTFTLPATDGTNGQVLTTNGSGVLSFITPSAGIAFQSSVKTSGFTAVAGEGYFCNTTSSAFTVTLPASPSAGNQVAIVDYAGTFATNNITLSPNGNKINGSTDNKVLSTDREGVTITFIDSTQGYLATSGVNEGAVALSPAPYSIEYLVVAGGGSGGREGVRSGTGGGGGAGGLLTSTYSAVPTTVYTVTVGAGGAGSSSVAIGNNGSNSLISGTGLTTITSTAGGGGGGGTNSPDCDGNNGGSGGGAGNDLSSAGTGVSGQGFAGGVGSHPTPNSGGGGGGAGELGNTDGMGFGGDGVASSITGSSVSYAGGGSGAIQGTGNDAGTGGGGKGAFTNVNTAATSGTANTGGGGGGAENNAPSLLTSGSGGSGVVILRMLTTNYTGTTTGSPTVTTDGSHKVVTFTGSGSYTA
jgi:hypothetical protein